MKPRSQCGGIGVKLCCSAEQAKQNFHQLAETLPSEVFKSGVIVETAIELGPPPASITVALDFPWFDDLGTHNEITKHAERVLASGSYSRTGVCVYEVRAR